MHLEVNEHGHIFLINRLNNTLYFFYKNIDHHKLVKLKFPPDFVLESADSSSEYLILKAKEVGENEYDEIHRIRVLSIGNMVNCEDHNRLFDDRDLNVVFDSKKMESEGVKKEIVGMDTYTYKINDCKLKDDKIIIKVTDNSGVKYLKVYDILKGVMTYYIEGERFLLSGDK
jgi:hypothetical protein